MSLIIKESSAGLEFEVMVQPRASRERIGPVVEGRLKIALTAPPVEGAANKALIRLLSRTLGIAQSQVEIVAGESGRRKRMRVRGVSPDELTAAFVI